MAIAKINLNGVSELDLTLEGKTTAALTSPGVVSVANTLPVATVSSTGVVRPDGTTIVVNSSGVISASGSARSSAHDEPLTDGNANFIFAATLSEGGDIIVVTGVSN